MLRRLGRRRRSEEETLLIIQHREPTFATIKYLYAHAYRCAFKGCTRPLYKVDEQTGVRTLNSRVCHVHARSEGGPRWNLNQSPQGNRSEQNLILLCVEHASTIDDPATHVAYTANLLREWKAKQLQEFDSLRQGWAIDRPTAKQAIGASFSNVEIAISGSILNLGGGGGNAPGAAGGGGGAVGKGARAGHGGVRGKHVSAGRKSSTSPWDKDASRPTSFDRAMSQPSFGLDFIPGAGGGGAGAIGDAVSAGDGGGGGDYGSGFLNLADFGPPGSYQIEFAVGQGGFRPRLPGQHGQDGEGSRMRVVSHDGTVLKSFSLAGGTGGRSGESYLPAGVPELLPEDIDGGFRITTLMVVNAAELREGSLFILGGGWTELPFANLPAEAVWRVACTARWKDLETVGPKGLYLSLINPEGREVSCLALTIPAEMIAGGSANFCISIGANFDKVGTWTLLVHSGGFSLSYYNVKVVAPLYPPTTPERT